MTRLALAVVLTATAGVTAIVTHHKRPVQVQTMPAPVHNLDRASRGEKRVPLRTVNTLRSHSGEGPSRPARALTLVRRAEPAGAAAQLSDVTMYCATGYRNAAGRWPRLGDVAVLDRTIPFGTRVRIDGNVFTVMDWIGSGSQYDIFGGNDARCEARALDFGRRRLEVVVER